MPRTWGLQTDARGHVEVVLSQQVSGKFSSTLGVEPYLGEPLSTMHDQSGNQQFVWFTYDAWSRLLGGARDAVGKLVWINAKAYRIAGVLPRSFDFPFRGDSAEIYIPLNREDYFGSRGPGALQAIARLRQPGQFTATIDGVSYRARNLTERVLGDRLRLIRWLFAAVVALVLVAMANASGISIAQWLKQQQKASHPTPPRRTNAAHRPRTSCASPGTRPQRHSCCHRWRGCLAWHPARLSSARS